MALASVRCRRAAPVKPAEGIVKPQFAAAALFAGDRIEDLDHRLASTRSVSVSEEASNDLYGAKQGMHRRFATRLWCAEQKRRANFSSASGSW